MNASHEHNMPNPITDTKPSPKESAAGTDHQANVSQVTEKVPADGLPAVGSEAFVKQNLPDKPDIHAELAAEQHVWKSRTFRCSTARIRPSTTSR